MNSPSDDVNLTLSRDQLGQMIDGLEVLIEQWEATAECLKTGTAREDVCIRECRDAREADAIADTYRTIQDRLYSQLTLNA